MKKNDIIEAICIDYTYDGMGIVKVDNFPVFIPNVIVGEKIQFKILKLHKNFAYGKVLEYITKSKDRVTPRCEYYGRCGGCQLQHMNYESQLAYKKYMVESTLHRIGKVQVPVEDVIGSDMYHYRNKAQFPVQVQDSVVMGFYRVNSNSIVDMNTCHIQSDTMNTIFRWIKAWLQDKEYAQWIRHVVIKHAFHTNQVMVIFVARQDIMKLILPDIDYLVSSFSMIQSVILNINNKETNVILGKDEYVLYGSSFIQERLLDLDFQIAAKSFYQVNPTQTKALYEKVVEFANLQPQDRVLDLYCGVGSITLLLAKYSKHVIGVEVVEDAIRNAKQNARLNNISHVDFICSDAATYVKQLDPTTSIDVVVIDPPRKGCDEVTIQSIVTMQPSRIVYVSCNPSTLARDLRRFEDLGYSPKLVQPVDMFPNTYHVETVVLLTRKN